MLKIVENLWTVAGGAHIALPDPPSWWREVAAGRLEMREWKMRYGQNCKGGKCRSKPYGTPTRYYIETALSDFVILVLILLTE